VFSKPAWSVET